MFINWQSFLLDNKVQINNCALLKKMKGIEGCFVANKRAQLSFKSCCESWILFISPISSVVFCCNCDEFLPKAYLYVTLQITYVKCYDWAINRYNMLSIFTWSIHYSRQKEKEKEAQWNEWFIEALHMLHKRKYKCWRLHQICNTGDREKCKLYFKENLQLRNLLSGIKLSYPRQDKNLNTF